MNIGQEEVKALFFVELHKELQKRKPLMVINLSTITVDSYDKGKWRFIVNFHDNKQLPFELETEFAKRYVDEINKVVLSQIAADMVKEAWSKMGSQCTAFLIEHHKEYVS